MSFEFPLFDEAARDRLVDFASAQGIASTTRRDELAGYIVELPDGLSDAQLEAVEAEYDAIMDQQMLAAESDADLVSLHAVGVTVTLADGTTRPLRLPPAIARRLLEHFAPDEVHEIASAIAQSLQDPADGPLCRKPGA